MQGISRLHNTGALISILMLFAISAIATQNGKIAFARDHDDSSREIYVMNPDGTDQVRLTSNFTLEDHPTWSPDGRRSHFWVRRLHYPSSSLSS